MNSKSPGLGQKSAELVVPLNLCGNGRVVVEPLSAGDHARAVSIAEAAQKLDEGVIDGHFTASDLGVRGAVENLLELDSAHCVLTVNVELVVGLMNQSSTALARGSSDSNKELLVVDEAISASVEVVEKNAGLALCDFDVEVLKSPVEFLLVDEAV